MRSIGELFVALVDVCCLSRCSYIPCRYLAVVGGVPFLVESNLQIHQRRCVKTISRRCGCLAASRAASGMGFRGTGRRVSPLFGVGVSASRDDSRRHLVSVEAHVGDYRDGVVGGQQSLCTI